MAPLKKYSADDAFRNLKSNPFGEWPRADDPDNRFAGYADPSFAPDFTLTPGQKIFTIGSCFARNIERVLAEKGFDIPTQTFAIAHSDWAAGNPEALLNNYVPAAIAPQIRWAFGLEPFDPSLHCAEVRPDRFVDLHLRPAVRPIPIEQILARREEINALYRHLATSEAVVITLGYIEAWYDTKSKSYINGAPVKSVIAQDPQRFEMHILDYTQVRDALEDLVTLLNRVCPAGYRMILTVSPVPIGATFTTDDVAVANMYSKSVLRAAAGALCARHAHIDYFPSFESVLLTSRELAYVDDQVHVTPQLIRFNVDRMLRRYLASESGASVEKALAESKAARWEGNIGGALKLLQECWPGNENNAELAYWLAKAHFQNGAAATAERLLTEFSAHTEDARILLLLAEHYIGNGRYADAAVLAERAAALGAMKVQTALIRAQAYYHLERYEEGLTVLQRTRQAADSRPVLTFWQARLLEKTGDDAGAEEAYRRCNELRENIEYMLGFATFLAERERAEEALEWCEKVLAHAPSHAEALRLRRRVSGALSAGAAGDAGKSGLLARMRGYFRG